MTDLGGRTSHTAIVARSLDIPAAVGVHKRAANSSARTTWVVIDGDAGLVIVDPIGHHPRGVPPSGRSEGGRCEKSVCERLRHTPAVDARTGYEIDLLANIEMSGGRGRGASTAGAVGVGLFRSEFLVHEPCAGRCPTRKSSSAPTARAVESMMGLPVTIRTIDIGRRQAS
ncbi:PEP-utilizing enzyme [Cupriavidus basilensis]